MEPMATMALRAARKAADVMVRAFERLDELNVEEKSKNDYVSNVDKECEEIIIDALHTAYPDHGILAKRVARPTPLTSSTGSSIRWMAPRITCTACRTFRSLLRLSTRIIWSME